MPNLIFAGGIPLSLLCLITGITLGLTSRWGLFRHFWVVAKLVLLVSVICLGMFAVDPEGMAAALGAGAGVSDRQWGQVAVVSTQIVLLVAATTLSVFKPRRKIRVTPEVAPG